VVSQKIIVKVNKNKKEIIAVAGGVMIGLMLASQVLGAFSYERNPSGDTILNPVSFDVSFDDFGEMCDYAPEFQYWTIYLKYEVADPDLEYLIPEKIASTTKSYIFTTDLPISPYDEVKFACCPTDEILPWEEDECWDSETFEECIGAYCILFEVVPPPIPILDFSTGMVASMVAFAGELFTNLAPVLIVGLGLRYGLMYVVPKVIELLRIRK